MPMKKYIPIPIVLGSILIALLLIRSRPEAVAEKAEPETPFVKTMMIFPRTVQAAIQSQGIILPERELTILSEVNSKVEWVAPNMEAGSSFRQGDTLIVLDKRDYELALITAESNILNAEVNLQREKRNLNWLPRNGSAWATAKAATLPCGNRKWRKQKPLLRRQRPTWSKHSAI